MLFICFCSEEISDWTLVRSTPGSEAATSLVLIWLMTSTELDSAEEATSIVADPSERASLTAERAPLSDFIVVAMDQ